MRFETEYLLQKRLEILDYEARLRLGEKLRYEAKPCSHCRFLKECHDEVKGNLDARLCITVVKTLEKP